MNIFIAGHGGMVGSAILRKLKQQKGINIITCSRNDLDLLNQDAVNNFFVKNKINQVYLAAAKVGGIYANNTYPAEFIYENLMIEANVINASHINNVPKLLFLGSSCIYPKYAEQPIKEESLLTGLLEQTNEPYAIAKIAGIKLCESFNRQFDRDYRSVMPTNLYGPNDNFHSKNSHVIPALIKRFHEAVINNEKDVTIWGTGNALREFLHVNDMADACIHIMNLEKSSFNKDINPHLSHINIGTGIECSIKDLAKHISDVTKYKGKIIFDISYPDGTPRKLLDSSKINNMNWQHSIDLQAGLKSTYDWYKENIKLARQ
jgi:GDP-L-fucose synthase